MFAELSAQTPPKPDEGDDDPDRQTAAADGKPAAEAGGGLAAEQAQVAERFRELERLLLRMAELTAPTDPRRAALLRQAVAQSKQRDIDHQFEELVALLKQERLALVVKNQGEVQQDLAKLLELLLSEDRTKRIESEKERIREYLKRVNKIIKEQKGIQGETDRGGDAAKAGRQTRRSLRQDRRAGQGPARRRRPAVRLERTRCRRQAKGFAKKDKPEGDKPRDDKKDSQPKEGDDAPSKESKDADAKQKESPDKKEESGKSEATSRRAIKTRRTAIRASSQKGTRRTSKRTSRKTGGGQSGESGQSEQPPDSESPAQKRLEQAQRRMKEAQQKLEEAKRTDAKEKQAEAIKELEQAKADLEEILRQLREEEMSRTLAMLEARFRKMLDQQVEVYEGTKRLDKVAEAERDRDDEIEAGRLSRKEAQISTEADKALAVLREEGSAVAFPEAVTEMRDDMEQIVARLAEAKVGEVTQGHRNKTSSRRWKK